MQTPQIKYLETFPKITKEWTEIQRHVDLTPAYTLAFFSAFSNVNMEAVYYSEMSINFQQTTLYYIPNMAKR
jgi:hypothetical protein